MKRTTRLVVTELSTGREIHSVSVEGKTEAQIERVMSGMLRNMDTDRFCIEEKASDDD